MFSALFRVHVVADRPPLICPAAHKASGFLNSLLGASAAICVISAEKSCRVSKIWLPRLPFLVAQENDTEIVARLAAGDVMVMAGTHVLNRADYAVSEATIKDPRK